MKKQESDFSDVILQKFYKELSQRLNDDSIFSILMADSAIMARIERYARSTYKKFKDMILKYPSASCVDIDTYIKIQYEDHNIVAKLLKVMHDRYSKELVDSIQAQMSANNVKLTASDDNPFSGEIPTQFAPVVMPMAMPKGMPKGDMEQAMYQTPPAGPVRGPPPPTGFDIPMPEQSQKSKSTTDAAQQSQQKSRSKTAVTAESAYGNNNEMRIM